ncbi:MAG: GNAT family acetyltransferase, partial [Anaerostipes sp.]|nr:GNAT family acetyltransferase [Anaerostipes sp.]
MKLLIMCEGPNELEIVRILLRNDLLVFSEDDLLNLVPYHARQIKKSTAVQAALNIYPGEVKILRIGDGLNEKLVVPKEYE